MHRSSTVYKPNGGGGGGVMGVELKRHNDGFVSYKYASFGFSKRLTDGLESVDYIMDSFRRHPFTGEDSW